MYGFAENLDLLKQYRYLAKCGAQERLLYKDANLIEIGKSYLFLIKKQDKENNASIVVEVKNPAQFAFATDDSNAPGGVTYSMIKEYLKK